MSEKEFPGFEECIKLIRSEDPMTFEDGYHLLLPRISKYGDDLVHLIESEANPKIKARFIELLGECENGKYIPVFRKQLMSSFHEIVSWALTSLERLEAGKAYAKEFRESNPEWLD